MPSPSYLWFKEPREPLPDHISEDLIIPRLVKEDAGRYCCRAQNEVNVVFSAWVEVKVQKQSILNTGKTLFPVVPYVMMFSINNDFLCILDYVPPGSQDVYG